MSINDLVKYEFYLQNRHRNGSEGPLDWNITFPAGLSELGPSTFFLQVDSIMMVNWIPTIMEGVNDLFTYEYSVGNATPVRYSTIFSKGNYDVNDIIASMLAELQLRNPAFNLVYDSKQMLLSLFVPVNVVFSIVRPIDAPFIQENYAYLNPTDRFLELLGWSFAIADKYTIYGGAGGITWTPTNPVRMDGTMFLHLNISSNIPAFTSAGHGKHPVASFPVNAGFGGQIVAATQIQSVFPVHAGDLQSAMRFYISDEWGVNLSPHVPVNTPIKIRFSLRPPL